MFGSWGRRPQSIYGLLNKGMTATTLPLEVFTQRNFVEDFFDRSWNLLEKIAKSRFVPPFGGLRGNIHGSSVARWKARDRFPISANWTFFASCHGWGAMSKYWSKLCCLKGGWVTLSANFRGKGVVHQRILAWQNYSPWAITWCCLRDPTFSRFDTIPACDTHTDTQWWLLPAHH